MFVCVVCVRARSLACSLASKQDTLSLSLYLWMYARIVFMLIVSQQTLATESTAVLLKLFCNCIAPRVSHLTTQHETKNKKQQQNRFVFNVTTNTFGRTVSTIASTIVHRYTQFLLSAIQNIESLFLLQSTAYIWTRRRHFNININISKI